MIEFSYPKEKHFDFPILLEHIDRTVIILAFGYANCVIVQATEDYSQVGVQYAPGEYLLTKFFRPFTGSIQNA